MKKIINLYNSLVDETNIFSYNQLSDIESELKERNITIGGGCVIGTG